jgi:hypothetical protein
MKSPGNAIADAVLAAKTDEDRRNVASAYVAYGLGVLAAMDGGKAAAEVAYRFADALVSRGDK